MYALKKYMFGVITTFAVLCPLSSNAACGIFDKRVSFNDGSSACMNEFSFLNVKGLMKSIPNESYYSKSKSHNSYAVAVTAEPLLCPFEQSMQWDRGGDEARLAVSSCESKMRAAVQALGKSSSVQNCKCEVLIDNGKSNLTRVAFVQKTKLYERQISLGFKPIQIIENEIKEQSEREAEAKRQAEAKKREDEIAIRKEFEEAEAKRLAEREAEAKKQAEAKKLEDENVAARKDREEADRNRVPQVPAQVTFVTERRVALVIGNSAYKVSPLDNPTNDATDITNALSRVGFKTTLIRNATLGQMREATRKFADQLLSADVALIYYAGHGIESNRKNYLIPVNADLKFEYELVDQAYDAGNWLEMLETIRSSNSERVNILILDACRNNNLIGARSLGRGLGRMDAPTGTFLAYSTAPGKVAADGSKGQRNSPYTRHLLSAIRKPGLPIEETFKEVRRNVSRETNGAQVPWESTSLVGGFYFTNK